MNATIPELEKSPAGNKLSGSWVIVDRSTGKGVFETFRKKTAEAINQKLYEVQTAAQYLGSLSQQIKEGA